MNMQSLVLVTEAASLPVSLTEAKEHLRVDTSDDDGLITSLIHAAADFVAGRNGYTGRALLPQTWDAYFAAFTDIELPLPPCIEVTAITYKDSDSATQTLATSVYTVNTARQPALVTLKPNQEWPATDGSWDAVKIRFQCGYPNGSPASEAVPYSIKAAIKLVIGDLYHNREGGNLVNGAKYEINPTVRALLNPYRVDMGL